MRLDPGAMLLEQPPVSRTAPKGNSYATSLPVAGAALASVRLESPERVATAAAQADERSISRRDNRSQQFNVDAYVDSIWESKLVPTVIEKAVDLSTLLAAFDADFEAARKQYGHDEAGGAVHFIVKGEGRISRVNSSSQNGAIVISLPNYKGKTEVVMQVGPVFRGTAIRDAVGFIQFNQFVNQLQFADVGNKLNDRVFTSVVNGFDLTTAQGKQVSFYGVFTFSERGKIIITPVKMAAGGKS